MGAFFISVTAKGFLYKPTRALVCCLLLHHEQRYRKMDNYSGRDDCRGRSDNIFLS